MPTFPPIAMPALQPIPLVPIQLPPLPPLALPIQVPSPATTTAAKRSRGRARGVRGRGSRGRGQRESRAAAGAARTATPPDAANGSAGSTGGRRDRKRRYKKRQCTGNFGHGKVIDPQTITHAELGAVDPATGQRQRVERQLSGTMVETVGDNRIIFLPWMASETRTLSRSNIVSRLSHLPDGGVPPLPPGRERQRSWHQRIKVTLPYGVPTTAAILKPPCEPWRLDGHTSEPGVVTMPPLLDDVMAAAPAPTVQVYIYNDAVATALCRLVLHYPLPDAADQAEQLRVAELVFGRDRIASLRRAVVVDMMVTVPFACQVSEVPTTTVSERDRQTLSAFAEVPTEMVIEPEGGVVFRQNTDVLTFDASRESVVVVPTAPPYNETLGPFTRALTPDDYQTFLFCVERAVTLAADDIKVSDGSDVTLQLADQGLSDLVGCVFRSTTVSERMRGELVVGSRTDAVHLVQYLTQLQPRFVSASVTDLIDAAERACSTDKVRRARNRQAARDLTLRDLIGSLTAKLQRATYGGGGTGGGAPTYIPVDIREQLVLMRLLVDTTQGLAQMPSSGGKWSVLQASTACHTDQAHFGLRVSYECLAYLVSSTAAWQLLWAASPVRTYTLQLGRMKSTAEWGTIPSVYLDYRRRCREEPLDVILAQTPEPLRSRVQLVALGVGPLRYECCGEASTLQKDQLTRAYYWGYLHPPRLGRAALRDECRRIVTAAMLWGVRPSMKFYTFTGKTVFRNVRNVDAPLRRRDYVSAANQAIFKPGGKPVQNQFTQHVEGLRRTTDSDDDGGGSDSLSDWDNDDEPSDDGANETPSKRQRLV